jgi:Asp-tRNA(Asn)/Glu-tRNA(Gln) amidotransferase A subunit family amidase
MDTKVTQLYDPAEYKLRSFHDAVPGFFEGTSTPRAYLEECLEVIDNREPVVKAFVHLNVPGARAAADASTARYRAGTLLSPVDGMPVGIKDLFETRDMPTEMGSPIWKDNQPFRDAAHVHALRQAGAVILGKTVTTELGMSHPGPTTNPFDPERTPGGSSSGSAAAVGACMLPAAIGSQVVGSIIRPAGFCANVAIKPTFGALNRGGGHSALSQSHLGVHAGSLQDAWAVMHAIHQGAGGDPGQPGLFGEQTLAPPTRPRQLARLATDGWVETDADTRDAFEVVIAWLTANGVVVLDAAHHPAIAALESAIGGAKQLCHELCEYELRWPLNVYRDMGPGKLSDHMRGRLERAEVMTPDRYRECLARRVDVKARMAELETMVDGLVTLSQPGIAPKGLASTGDPVFNAPTSVSGTPSISLPLMAVDGMPLGFQFIGFAHGDARAAGIARWMLESYQRP